MSAVAALAAASCNKVEMNEPQAPSINENAAAVEFVAYTEAQTKTTLNGLATEWELGDEITINGIGYVTDGEGNKVIFNKCDEEDASPVAPYYAAYPYAYANFYTSKSYHTITMLNNLTLEANVIGDCVPAVAYSESETSLYFQNVASLFKFQVPVTSDDITEIRISTTEALAGEIIVDQTGDVPTWVIEAGFDKYTELVLTTEGVFNPEATYYVPVLPGQKTNLTVTINGNVVASGKSIEFKRNVIHNLGTLPFVNEPKVTEYGVVGSFQAPTTWDVVAPVKMLDYGDGWAVAKDVELYKNDEFKFVTGNSWDNPNFGTSEVKVLEENVETDIVQGGQNMKVSKNGKYNLYMKLDTKKVKVECVEEYTNLTVDITIDNKANWSPLTISLWDGETQIVTNASVTNNKYSISGDYIGSTLTCQLASGTKTSEKMQVAITKTGATVTLEETIIKLKVQLNTANAKQWWGNTMKIHVWNTGTSFDTSWPGNTMTSEGNYTWSIIVPSELVGKTINFLVHNGNGWQSSDSKVTIKAEGNTVTGSSIGIN